MTGAGPEPAPEAAAARRPRDALVPVLLAAGAIGFFIGAVGYPDWQVAVETAQVLAGVVSYPPDNPFFRYHIQLWTLLHQLLAPLLRAGVDERTASLLVSGGLGMLSLQAIATVILAISRDPLLAVGGAVAVFFTRAIEYGVSYPVWFAGTSHTYGVVGLSWAVLVIGLLGGGWLRAGGLLLGLAPAVHPSLAVWLGLIVASGLALDLGRLRQGWEPALRPFLLGGAVSSASLLVQQVFVRWATPARPDPPELYQTFVAFWDYHRAPVAWDHPGVLFNVAVLAAAVFWLLRRPQELPGATRLLPRAAAAGAVLGLAAVAVSHVPPDRVPPLLLALMPTRVLNVAVVLSLPLLIGLLGRRRDHPARQGLLLFLLAALPVAAHREGDWILTASRLWELGARLGLDVEGLAKATIDSWTVMSAVAVALTFVARLPGRVAAGGTAAGPDPEGDPAAGVRQAAASRLRRLNLALLGTTAALTLALVFVHLSRRGTVYADRARSAVLAAASRGEGLLLTGGDLHLVQLRTRRPVLIDGGGLDGIAHARGALPAMADIVTRVYGIDYFRPPESGWGRGAIPAEINRTVWEQRPPEFWSAVRRRYGVTQVLTKADWSLALPLEAADGEFALYRLPPSAKP